MSPRGERNVYVRGIGQSQVGRRLMRSEMSLTIEASLAAVEDAGLTIDEIDGLATYPGEMNIQPGFAGPGSPSVQEALRLNLNWFSGGSEGAAQIQAVINACMAVSTGLARNVLVYRTVTESSAQVGGRGVAAETPEVGGLLEWLMPTGAVSAVHWLALVAQRYFHEFGVTRDLVAEIAINQRKNAALNPKAVYTEPLSMEDYLGARMISTPLCLFDCDVPIDGSTAFVISHVDTIGDAPKTPIHVNAVGTALRHRNSWEQWPSPTLTASADAAAHLWERTDLTPSDVDVAELYDGFSILTLLWIEALGFCGRGEAASFIQGGRIALDGALPINTHGGQLSAGRLHGFGFLHEACVQLRGEGGARQVAGSPQVAAVGNGGGPIGGAMLVTAGLG